jgi:peptide/nickel transport system substrate-binding protein
MNRKSIVLTFALLLFLMIANVIPSLRYVEATGTNTFEPKDSDGQPMPFGNWQEPNNWSGKHIPQPNEDVVIPKACTAKITEDEQKFVQSLTVAGRVEAANGFNTKIHANGDIRIDGTVTSNPRLTSDGKVNVAGQVLGASTIHGEKEVVISGKVLGNKGTASKPGGDPISISSAGNVTNTGTILPGAGVDGDPNKPDPGGPGGNLDIYGKRVIIKSPTSAGRGGDASGTAEGKGSNGGLGGRTTVTADYLEISNTANLKDGAGGDGTGTEGKGGNTGGLILDITKDWTKMNNKQKLSDPGKNKHYPGYNQFWGQKGEMRLNGNTFGFLPPGGLEGGSIVVIAEVLANFSYLYQGAINSSGSITVSTGPSGIIDLTGNPAGVKVLTAVTYINFITNNVLLDPNVSIADITSPVATIYPSPPIKNPGELFSAIPYGLQTVEPGWANDAASWKLLFNVYDTLLTFDGEHMDRFLPSLATSWAIQNINEKSPEGLDWTYRYVFQIRQGVKFQDGSQLTPQDIEYSLERVLVKDADFGPAWMLYEPLLYGESASFINQQDMNLNDPATIVKVGKMIDHAVESNETHVWFNIAFPGAYAPLLQILCQSWTSILSKQWVNDYVIGQLGRPDWNGEWGDYSGWINFYNPATSPLDDPTPLMMGTGPFKLESLDYTAKQWSVVRFPDYWRGWPADFPASGSAKPAGYIDRFVVTWAYDWETRKTMFLNGDIDICAVPRQNLNEILGKPGIRCISPLPSLAVDALFFNYNIDPTTPYGPINDYGVFNENGIPRDFFSNVNIRKAFAHSIDFVTFIQQSYLGEAMQPPTALIPGLPYYDATVQKYTYDLAKAKAYFEAVPGLMNTGFTITVTYNSGNTARMNLCNLLKTAIESISPKFHVTVATAAWSAYLYAENHGQLTAFTLSWLADYPDAHNFAYAFYHSLGNFAWKASYNNPAMDALINTGIRTPDGPARAKIYSDIQKLVIEDCPSVAFVQPVERHFERDWITGWYYNPIYPSGTYAYNLWKWYYIPQALFDNATTSPWSNSLSCDVNYDGVVNILDIFIVANAFGSTYGPPINPRWQFRADVNNDRVVNILDIFTVARYYGKTSAIWAPS